MTKLIIQIPCYNEEKTLGITLDQLPRELPGIDVVEWLIIDDGSTDRTVEVAKAHGVDHVVGFTTNQGLAKGFMKGLTAGLAAGADIIVNTDADNQYCADDIVKLVTPIVNGEADIVIGERPIAQIPHFSIVKKFLQKLGSFMVQQVSKTTIPDAPSGFRAISRDAAMRLNVFSGYTYTIEMIIQAGKQDMALKSVPIRVNHDLRPSRLVKSIPSYIKQSILTMFRVFNTYRPLQFFSKLGFIPFIIGVGLGVRWIVSFMGQPMSHIPSLILSALLIILGTLFFIVGLIADLIAVNRKLLEDIQYHVRQESYRKGE